MNIINFDCLQGMRLFIADNSIDAIVCDPPYELGFMGKAWDASGIAYNVEMWAEALRVLKPGGHLLAFSGSRTYHRMACAIEDAGFEVRDQILWIYASGMPKAKSQLKPAHEPICVARKPFQGSALANIATHGTGGLNIEACRVLDGTETGREKPEYRPNHANAVFGAGMGGGAWENTAGRWPANVIIDDDPEIERRLGHGRRAEDNAARFFYCAKASKGDRGEGNVHPTVKPTELMRYLVRLVTPPGGHVLDPFVGSGSTGKACKLEGFQFTGFELSPEYAAIARARIAAA